mmetsp:Transcript_36701/g.117908  ORF Transcript_36701/g.117908 Transcript_36701/m.117908 type:complete len:295 (+) Transcript_36701:1425-2309(+)
MGLRIWPAAAAASRIGPVSVRHCRRPRTLCQGRRAVVQRAEADHSVGRVVRPAARLPAARAAGRVGRHPVHRPPDAVGHRPARVAAARRLDRARNLHARRRLDHRRDLLLLLCVRDAAIRHRRPCRHRHARPDFGAPLTGGEGDLPVAHPLSHRQRRVDDDQQQHGQRHGPNQLRPVGQAHAAGHPDGAGSGPLSQDHRADGRHLRVRGREGVRVVGRYTHVWRCAARQGPLGAQHLAHLRLQGARGRLHIRSQVPPAPLLPRVHAACQHRVYRASAAVPREPAAHSRARRRRA